MDKYKDFRKTEPKKVEPKKVAPVVKYADRAALLKLKALIEKLTISEGWEAVDRNRKAALELLDSVLEKTH